MGIYGASKAFNLRYAQNSYRPQTFMRNRQPMLGGNIFGMGGNSVTNVTIKNGPSGFWGFMSGLFGGLTGGGMFGMSNMFGLGNLFGGGMCGLNSMGSYTSPFAALNNANATATTQQTPEQEQAQQLANLKALFPDVTFVAEKDGKFSASKKDGTLINEKTYDEMKATLGKAETQGTGVENDDDGKKKVQKEQKVQQEEQEEQQEEVTVQKDATQQIGKGNSSKGTSPAGWYRASNDKASNVNSTHNKDGSGKNATQITNEVLTSKLNGALTPAQQNELREVIIKKNPSVFNSDGTPKANADYTKLDVPTMAWIKEHILKETKEQLEADAAGNDSAKKRANKDNKTPGNNQYITNQLYQKGYRETYCKGIYYKDGKHYKLKENKLVTIKYNDIKQVNPDGSWYDTSGKLRNKKEENLLNN